MPNAAVRYDRGSPYITIQNESEWVSDDALGRVVRAVQKQIDRDFFPLWGWRAKLSFNREPPRRHKAMRIVVRDAPPRDDEDDLGYHFLEDGLPETFVFTRDSKDRPVEFHSTLSHEALEMIADPGVNLFAQGYYSTKTGRHNRAFIPYEVCDPVQENSYEIDGIVVSDFVVPEWFETERTRGSLRFSFLDSVRAPFEIAKSGYVDAVVGNRIRTIWGTKAYRKRRRHRFRARKLICGLD